ncbi:hypothetical conserved protein [Candidatus Nitrosoglobus terrae]|uniref:Hypothetical conserved protein n=1 Tax=Candidatus Nitrosoglobus terrae TaxID=1630141 RepID=A0A1Q2SNI5_9GAMM|nr:hypothetical protein [Candidatus Nitrosoglobus terrae]BAW80682.1 hypothetical conserved protein [Candidatus Nitrosoglobus terrae]
MSKNKIKIMIGGPLGALAWVFSAVTTLLIFTWKLEQVAFAVIAAKVFSWGMWAVGVIRQLPSSTTSLKQKRCRKKKKIKKWKRAFS